MTHFGCQTYYLIVAALACFPLKGTQNPLSQAFCIWSLQTAVQQEQESLEWFKVFCSSLRLFTFSNTVILLLALYFTLLLFFFLIKMVQQSLFDCQNNFQILSQLISKLGLISKLTLLPIAQTLQHSFTLKLFIRLRYQLKPQFGMSESQNIESSVEYGTVLKVIVGTSLVYLIFANISVATLIILTVIAVCIVGLIRLKISQIKAKGPDNFGPKMKAVLFQKSIFDIYSDILYFPTITRIIGAFLGPVLSKPNPEKLHETFQKLTPKMKEIISTKGILNIFPDKVRSIGYPNDQPLPPVISNDWTWCNFEKYKQHEQVHEDTLAKRFVQKIDNKVNWGALGVMGALVFYGLKRMGSQRAQRMLIQNGCFAGILLVLLIAIIKIARNKKQKHRGSHLQIQARIVQDDKL